MPDPGKVLVAIRNATAHFLATPGRAGSIVTIPSELIDDVLIVGDLHGHVEVLSSVIRTAALDTHAQRHLILQELVHDSRINPDEGELDRSHRAIDLACALTCMFPGRVHYLLGNHELSELTGRSISKQGHPLNNLFRKGVEADYPSHVGPLMEAYHALFRALPLVIKLPNRVVACHTIPDSLSQESLDRDVLTRGDWTEQATRRGGTVYALTWSRDNSDAAADQFARWIDGDLFVCGHQPFEAGFHQSNARTLILDGTNPNPTYALFSAQQRFTIEQLVASTRRVPLNG